ncbi:serine/threonine-protein kinase [Nocardia arthritidis]|uniref:Protein kinase n=1 Tax=Nocardia arthritidis TaxID=228602 RepID=A0A6G9YS02_9NOCA|nr:serine/threonine-protein kinase [Nocardia arthritidis]QIS15974.1 protein kinase [Nocardia arthritidis]
MKPLGERDPRIVGRHRLLAVIGQGAMGRVFLGRAPDGRLVAVKTVHRHLARNPEFRNRFRLEVQASRRVTGAYTAAVMDADPDAESPWLASVFVPGPALRDAIESGGPMLLGGLRLLTAGLAGALLEIHRAGIVHRDLKPSNVLLADEGPRVIDFGIARAMEADLQLTATGSLIGSPAYMSPEQASGHELTPASDVFAVGAMLVLAATGQSPFLGSSTPQTLYNVVHNRADTSRVPPALRPVIDACLDKNPSHRPTPTQLLEAVDAMTARSGWPGSVRAAIAQGRAEAQRWDELDGRLPDLEKPRRSRRWIAVAAAVVLLACAGTAAVVLTRGQADTPTDPLAGRTLQLSEDQLRLVDSCQLLGTDVIGKLGQPVKPGLTDSATCTTDFVTGAGMRTKLTVAVGTPIAATAGPTSDRIAGRPVVDTTGENRSCGRAVVLGDQPPHGVDLKIDQIDGDSCGLVISALKAVVTRLVTNFPSANPPKQSVVRMDPCTSVDPAIIAAASGSNVSPSPVDAHTCMWTGTAAVVTVHTAESKRVDSDPGYLPVIVNGGKQGDFQSRRRIDADGTCATYYLVRPTIEDRGEMITVTVLPKTAEAGQTACASTEAVLTGVVARLREL